MLNKLEKKNVEEQVKKEETNLKREIIELNRQKESLKENIEKKKRENNNNT